MNYILSVIFFISIFMRGCTLLPTSCTSSCDAVSGWFVIPILVITDMPNTFMPQCLATITSGTVLMPTASAPNMW